MISFLLLAILSSPQGAKSLFPADAPYKDRAGFYRAMSRLSEDMPKARVRALLGTPDDIRGGKAELDGLNAGELWCYGTDRHMGFPTLGQVCILDGKVFWWSGRMERPFKQLMPEQELRAILRKLARPGGRSLRYDPLWMIQAANALIDLRKDKTVFAFQELDRIGGELVDVGRIGSLARLVFEVPNPPGYPPDISNMMMKELLPKFRKGPRFPMIVFDDVPFSLSIGGHVGHGPYFNVKDFEKHPIRTTRLHPPDDPFKTYSRLLASDQWPFPARSKGEARFARRYEEDEGEALEQVLHLVRDVYQPVDFRSTHGIDGLDFDKYYTGFKTLQIRWDDARQRYVRRDGATLIAKRQPPERSWVAPKFNGLIVEIRMARDGESDYVNAGFSFEFRKGAIVLPEVLRFIDASTGRILAWMPVNDLVPGGGFRRDNGFEASFLAKPQIKLPDMSGGHSVGLHIPLKTSVRVELATRKGRIRGPILRP